MTISLSTTTASPSAPRPGSLAAAAEAKLQAARQDYEKDVKSTSVADLVGTTPCCKKAKDKLQADLGALKVAQQCVDQLPVSSPADAYGEF